MSELPLSTINFCYHNAPFVVEERPVTSRHVYPAPEAEVRANTGVIICQCHHLHDAWSIRDALNHVATLKA